MLNLIGIAFAVAIAAAPASPTPPASAAPVLISPPFGVQPVATPPPVDGLTVADIVAKSRAASGAGKVVANETQVWKIHSYGVEGTTRIVRRGRDWASTTELGSFATATGVSAGKPWRQNENGETLGSRLPDDANDVLPVTQKLDHVTSPIDAYVVESVAANGDTSRRFYDARSFLVVRHELNSYGRQAFTVYDDFITNSAGRTFARHISGGNQFPDNAWDEQLVSDDLKATVGLQDVAIPAISRTLIEFPAGVTTVRLPARIVNGAIIVRVDIAGRGVDLLLDSGAGSIVLDRGVASSLGLQVEGEHTQTIAGNVRAGEAKIPEMKIGNLTLHNVAVDTLQFSETVSPTTKALGLLGFDFFDGAAITIDYTKGTVDATAPSTFTPDAGATEVPARFERGVPEVDLAMGPTKGDHFIVDTGAQEQTIVLFQRFVHLNERKIPRDAREGAAPFRAEMVGGEVRNVPIIIRDVVLGEWRVPEVHGMLTRSPAAFDYDDGLIGSEFLSLFKITIDEPHRKLYFTPVEDQASASPAPLAQPSDPRR
jgi:predicted aspartyl protease